MSKYQRVTVQCLGRPVILPIQVWSLFTSLKDTQVGKSQAATSAANKLPTHLCWHAQTENLSANDPFQALKAVPIGGYTFWQFRRSEHWMNQHHSGTSAPLHKGFPSSNKSHLPSSLTWEKCKADIANSHLEQHWNADNSSHTNCQADERTWTQNKPPAYLAKADTVVMHWFHVYGKTHF